MSNNSEEIRMFVAEDFCKVFINKYYKKDPSSPKSLFDLPESERYANLLVYGFNDSFRKEYGITLDGMMKWYNIYNILSDLIELKKPNIKEYEKWCKDNNMDYVIIDNFTLKLDDENKKNTQE